MSDLSIDVVAVSETRLSKRINLNISGYTCYRNDKHHSGKGQGVAIFVKADLSHSLISTPITEHIEAIGVQLRVDKATLTIFAIYQSPNLPLITNDLDTLLETDTKVLLMGDLNAKHDHWYPGLKNTNGNLLFNHLINRDYIIYAPNSPTLVHYNVNYTKSLPDLILAKNITNINNVETIPALSSNHLPVFFCIKLSFERIIVKRFNFAKADWSLYRSNLNNNIFLSSSVFKRKDEIDTAITDFTECIIGARDVAVPQTTVSNAPKPPPRKIRRLLKFRNRLRRDDQKETNPTSRKCIRTQINYLNKNIKVGFKNHNDQTWIKKLSKVDNPGSDLWRLAKSMKSPTATSILPPLRREDNSQTSTTKEQCEELASTFQKNMTLTSEWHDKDTEAEVCCSVSILNSLKSEPYNINAVHPKEIKKHILQFKSRKAPGFDNVSNSLVKNLPQKALVLLTKIFNACLALAYFPDRWKTGKVIAIKKPGKDATIPSSYRPISLLPSLAKLFEKIINTRLIKFSYNKLIDEQFGFRQAHSTAQQLARVAENVAHNQNKGRSTGMFLLDIEKAFDTVWHKGLLHKLIANEIPLPLVKLIDSYLSNRNFNVHIGRESSSSRSMPAGVPQGSILGPYLFIMYLNDIPKQTRTSLACFADDTACYTSSPDDDLIIDRLQLAIDGLTGYFHKWKLKLNTTKTEAIFFTRARARPIKQLKIEGYLIPWSNSVKYLGLVLDQKLTWNEHVSQLRLKGMKAFSALNPLMNRRSILSSKTKLNIYSTLIRPCITYGCPVWSNTSKTNHQKLQVLQNKALKLAFNTPFRTNLTKLHDTIHFPTLFQFILKLTKKFYLTTNPNNQNNLIAAIGKAHPQKLRYKYLTKLPHHYTLAVD